MSTIFALTTPAIKSGIAVFRISGPKAAHVFKCLTKKPLPQPRYVTRVNILSAQDSELIDNALAIWFPAPNSFTGEDTIEFHTHGSRAIYHILIEELSSIQGLRLANPGEFSRKSFENGKMDLTEAEGLADLIDAETKIQAKQALKQMEGALGELYERWRNQLVTILARLEAYIDFPDEDIPSEVIDEIYELCSTLNSQISEHLNDKRIGERIRLGANIVILGAPNVGKSSLMNLLAKREVAIVSEEAGTTRDTIEIHLDLNGYPATIIDTAGLRSTQNEIESEGIRRARNKAENADIKLAMFDASKLPDLDKETLELIDSNSIVLINKIDNAKNVVIPQLKSNSIIPISVVDNQGILTLIEKLQNLVSEQLSNNNLPVITHERHRILLQEALSHLSEFNLNKGLELATEDLRSTAKALGKITGRIDVEELLDEIFSNFCIGK